MITETQFRQMMPNAGSRLDAHWPYINPALEAGRITAPHVIAAFLAQVAEESEEYQYMEEIADGSEYEGRLDLGNTEPGDGTKYKGHGPIEITGRANHVACGRALGIDLINNPRLLTLPQYGTASAVWYWNTHGLTMFANVDWFLQITLRVNGGYNGLAERVRYWERNLTLLGLPTVDVKTELTRIESFQTAHNLFPDGIVGPLTIHALVGDHS